MLDFPQSLPFSTLDFALFEKSLLIVAEYAQLAIWSLAIDLLLIQFNGKRREASWCPR